MKKILLLLFLLISISAYAQKLPDMGLNMVHIVELDKTVVAELDEAGTRTSVKSTLFYFWYAANTIHSTQGGFSGTLLDGGYTEYYLNKNLKEQGSFKRGLKNGTWKNWNEDGTLIQTIIWKNGLIFTQTPKKFWKKLNIFKHKPKPTQPDSLVNPITHH
jgi:hypothetical protein